MNKGLNDQIMILEGLEGSGNRLLPTEVDVLSAIADFPKHSSESLLSYSRSSEDSLADVVGLGELGLGPRRHHRRHGGGYRYPIYTQPTYIEPIIATAEVVGEATSIRRIRDLEKKLAALHPDKVKLLRDGIEGLGDLLPTGNKLSSVLNAELQIGAIQRAARDPSSYTAKVIVNKLDEKAKELDKLASDRQDLAAKSIKDYQRDKKTVEKLDRVAKQKSLTVVQAAATRSGDPAVEKQMNRVMDDVRKLHDRSAAIGRRAIGSMKTFTLANMLAKNADGQAMLTKAAKIAVASGKPEEAKILTAGINKHSENARRIKGIRTKQVQSWATDYKQDIYNRLSSRRERYLKAIALLNQKSASGSGLSEEDQRNLRDATAQLFRVEATMHGLKGGVAMPVETGTTDAMNLGSTPTFSVDMKPNDPSGTFLESLYVNNFNAKTSIPDPSGRFLSDLEAEYVSLFSTKTADPDPSGRFLGEDYGVKRYEPKFMVSMAPLPAQGKWFENAAFAWFSDAGDLVNDTKAGLMDVFSPFIKATEVSNRPLARTLKNIIGSPGIIASGSINPVKLVGASTWKTLRNAPADTLIAAAQALKSKSKGVDSEVKRQARSMFNYAKSSANSVCSSLSQESLQRLSSAASSAAGIDQSAVVAKYTSKICGRAGGMNKALGALNDDEAIWNLYEPTRMKTRGGRGLTDIFPSIYHPIRYTPIGEYSKLRTYEPVRDVTFGQVPESVRRQKGPARIIGPGLSQVSEKIRRQRGPVRIIGPSLNLLEGAAIAAPTLLT